MTGFTSLPLAEQGPSSDVQWRGISKITGPQWSRFPVLTIGLLGVHVLWSVEMSYGSPYLLSLGLSKSYMSLVFLAGPLSGLIVQPLIGVLADHSKSRFGRRRPYMISGSILCFLAMLLLGYTRPFASIFIKLGTTANDVLTIWLAVLSIYCIDFAINAVMAADRALMVDILPTSEQPSGTAWAARMLSVGSVAGFYIGHVDLVSWFPIFGTEQLEILTVIASFLLLFTHSLTAYFVKEKVLVSSAKSKKGFLKAFQEIFSNILTLPRIIRQIFIIQLFAWLGWFPFLFYTSIYIGELHKRASPKPSPTDLPAIRLLEAEATRLGSRALLFNSLLSLAANLVLPYFVKEAAGNGGRNAMVSPLTPRERGAWWTFGLDIERFRVHLASLWAVSHLVFALCMGATFFISSVGGATFVMTITGFSWAVTQWAPFSLLAEAILSDPSNNTDIEELGSIRVTDTRTWSRSDRSAAGGAYADADEDGDERQFLVGGHRADGEDEEGENRKVRSRTHSMNGEGEDGLGLGLGRLGVMSNPEAQLSRLDVHNSNGDVNGVDELEDNVSGGGLSAKAGIILGIHNVCIVIPQLVIAGLSSIIFAIFEPGISALQHGIDILPANGTSISSTEDPSQNVTHPLLRRPEDNPVSAKEGVNSVAIVFRIGGLAAAVACVLCWRLAKELRHR